MNLTNSDSRTDGNPIPQRYDWNGPDSVTDNIIFKVHYIWTNGRDDGYVEYND